METRAGQDIFLIGKNEEKLEGKLEEKQEIALSILLLKCRSAKFILQAVTGLPKK
jgi:hypothetical protein